MKILNRVLALLLGLIVIGAAVVLVIEVTARRVGARPVVLDWPAMYRWAHHTTWGAAPVRAGAVLLALAGLAVIGSQLRPRRPDRLALASDPTSTDAAVTRQGVAHSVRTAVTEIDGVDTARVSVRRRVTVNAGVHADQDTQGYRDTITRVAGDAVTTLRLRRPPRISVHVTTGRR